LIASGRPASAADLSHLSASPSMFLPLHEQQGLRSGVSGVQRTARVPPPSMSVPYVHVPVAGSRVYRVFGLGSRVEGRGSRVHEGPSSSMFLPHVCVAGSRVYGVGLGVEGVPRKRFTEFELCLRRARCSSLLKPVETPHLVALQLN
jgi:hypothetical protein